MRLKEKLEERLYKLSEAEKRLQIEYNPLTQLKKDLGYKTKRDIEEEELLREYAETRALESSYKGYKSLPGKDIVNYCLHSDYVFIKLDEYKSELSDKCLEAIQKFITDNKIQFLKGYFWILCPEKYGKNDNDDYSNIRHNIYFIPDYTSTRYVPDKVFIEVYGSDFTEGSISKKAYNILKYGSEEVPYNIYKILPYISIVASFLLCLNAFFNDSYPGFIPFIWIFTMIIIETIFYIIILKFNEDTLYDKSRYILDKNT